MHRKPVRLHFFVKDGKVAGETVELAVADDD
jgi:hypothetical protein